MSIICKLLHKFCKPKPTYYKKPKNIIKVDQAVEMYHNYTNRTELIHKYYDGIGDNDKESQPTRSLFYDLDDLYNYLGYIKQLSRKAKVEPSGIRIYFAEYSEGYVRNDSKEYSKRQTIFITPTVEEKGVHLGYTLDENLNINLLRDVLDQTNSKERVFFAKNQRQNDSDNSDQNSLIANEFTGSPPKGNH